MGSLKADENRCGGVLSGFVSNGRQKEEVDDDDDDEEEGRC